MDEETKQVMMDTRNRLEQETMALTEVTCLKLMDAMEINHWNRADVKNRYEAYGVATEYYDRARADMKEVEADLKAFREILGAPMETAAEPMAALGNSVYNLICSLLQMTAECRSMTKQLYDEESVNLDSKQGLLTELHPDDDDEYYDAKILKED